jgi:hypothetical protein
VLYSSFSFFIPDSIFYSPNVFRPMLPLEFTSVFRALCLCLLASCLHALKPTHLPCTTGNGRRPPSIPLASLCTPPEAAIDGNNVALKHCHRRPLPFLDCCIHHFHCLRQWSPSASLPPSLYLVASSPGPFSRPVSPS